MSWLEAQNNLKSDWNRSSEASSFHIYPYDDNIELLPFGGERSEIFVPVAVDQPVQKKASWFRTHTTGWRFGVLNCAITALVVFCTNLGVFVWAERRAGFTPFSFPPGDSGQHSLFNGSCEETRQLNTGVHLLINVLSTLLLSASNYCMQCMSAPTRKEVDKAHQRKKWVDIGIQSFRNLFKISGKRVLLYSLLGVSSLPLHLFYNSVIFTSIAANDYYVYSANAAFTSPETTSFLGLNYGPDEEDPYSYDPEYQNFTASRLFDLARQNSLTRLFPSDCLTQYAQVFQTGRGSLLMITPDDAIPQFNQGTAALVYEYHERVADNSGNSCPFQWMCYNHPDDPPGTNDGCNEGAPCQFRLGPMKSNISSWEPFAKEVLYCLSEDITEHCKLQYSVHLAVVVIILNAVKTALMLWVALAITDAPLMTIGDAVVSFIDKPDDTTVGMCLVSKKEIIQGANKNGGGWVPLAKQFDGKRQRRYAAASTSRWVVTLGLVCFALVLVGGLLIWGIGSIRSTTSLGSIMSLGLGAITPVTFIEWQLPSKGANGLVLNVLVANAAQVVLSFIYFSYNALFTCMALAREWSGFAGRRKGMRVSSVPLGHQRVTYFLQLPYRFALPLMLASAALHWLVSQSIFLVAIDAFKVNSDVADPRALFPADGFMTCGYSPLAMILVLLVGIAMFIAALSFGCIRLSSAMPVVGSCSAAVSASCHDVSRLGKDGGGGERYGDGEWNRHNRFEERRGKERLMWGVVFEGGENEVGHCAISEGQVEGAVEGRWYAGWKCDSEAKLRNKRTNVNMN